MLPTFKPNSYVICLKSNRIRVNDVVVLEDKKIGKVLKRVKSFNDDKVTLKGDNNSYNSKVMKLYIMLQILLVKWFLNCGSGRIYYLNQ